MEKTELETLIKLFKTDNITESSARIYAMNILKLSKDFNIKLDEKSFSDFDINKIKNDENISDNTKKNKIISIIKYLKAYNQSKELIQKFSDEADIFSSKIDRKKRKLEKTEREKENWITKDELNNKIDELHELIKDDILKDYSYINNYMKYISLLIHSEIPLRNDLSDAEIFSINDFKLLDPEKDKNYIILNQKVGYIILFNFKTVKSKGAQKIKIPKDILKELNKYFKELKLYKKINKITNNHFLLQKNGDKLTRNDYTKFFNEIFKGDNKLISTSLIRKIITSETWNIKEIKELSDKMQHTVIEALKSYVKI